MNNFNNKDKLYNLKLHETMIAEDNNLFTVVLRVPGGWFYRSYDKEHQVCTGVFVPNNYEFNKDAL